MALIVSVTEFKARCLDLFDQLSRRELDGVTVTRRGKVVAEVQPPKWTKDEVLASIGRLRERTRIDPAADLTKPVFDGELDADLGILHR